MILRHPGWNPDVLPPLDIDEKDVEHIADEFEQFISGMQVLSTC